MLTLMCLLLVVPTAREATQETGSKKDAWPCGSQRDLESRTRPCAIPYDGEEFTC